MTEGAKPPSAKNKTTSKKGKANKETKEADGGSSRRVRHMSRQYEAKLAALGDGAVAPPGGTKTQDGGRRSTRKKNLGLNEDIDEENRSENPQTRLKETFDSVSSSESSDIESDNESEQDNYWVCKACTKSFHTDDCKMLECEKCEDHYCTVCLEMSDSVYHYMQNTLMNPLWCCQACSFEICQALQNKGESLQLLGMNTDSCSLARDDMSRIGRMELKLDSYSTKVDSIYKFICGKSDKNEPTGGMEDKGQTSSVWKTQAWKGNTHKE